MSRSEMGADDLRKVFQGQPRDVARGEECPDPETIWASARGELSPEGNRQVIDHTGRCPSCAEDWRMARFVCRRADETGGDLARGRRRATGSRRWLAAAAAVLVAILGGVSLHLWQTEDREMVLRDQPGEVIESRTPEDQPLRRAHPTLRWSGPEDARYSLVVTTAQLRVIVRKEGLRETEYTLPEAAVSGLEPGTTLLWHVEAVLPDGSRAMSQTFFARIE